MKMNIKTLGLALLLTGFMFSCKEVQQPEIHVMDEHDMQITKKLDVEVDNEFDFVCGMETAEFLSDTIHYNGHIYGFCSTACKKTFAEDPESYLKNL